MLGTLLRSAGLTLFADRETSVPNYDENINQQYATVTLLALRTSSYQIGAMMCGEKKCRMFIDDGRWLNREAGRHT